MGMPCSAPPTPKGQRGVALIAVMLAVALSSIVMADILSRQFADIRRSTQYQRFAQARQLALVGERYARGLLTKDGKGIDSPIDKWARKNIVARSEQMTVELCIFDLQGYFNLNSLVLKDGNINPIQRMRLDRLFRKVGVDPKKVGAIIDWLDKDSDVDDQDGAERHYYEQLASPYRVANQPFSDLSELRLVKGFSENAKNREALDTVLPYLRVLPEDTALNVNTAHPMVLQALHDDLDSETAEELHRYPEGKWRAETNCRREKLQAPNFTIPEDKDFHRTPRRDAGGNVINSERSPYSNVKEFSFWARSNNINLDTQGLDVKSSFFGVRVDIDFGDSKVRQYSVLRRDNKGKIAVLSRRYDNL